jgi:hypothetical protein
MNWTADQFPIGSRWYAWGRWWEVVDHKDKDGFPGITVKLEGARKRSHFSYVLRLFARRATPARAS